MLTARQAHAALATALGELEAASWSVPEAMYARSAWAGHWLAAGDAQAAVRALGRCDDPARPGESRDRWAAHVPAITTALGADHPATLGARVNLAGWRGYAGDFAGAVAAFEELLPELQRVLGPDHPLTLTARAGLAAFRGRVRDFAGAVAALKELLPDLQRVLGPDHPETLNARANLATWRGHTGDFAGAVAALEQLLPDTLQLLGPDHLLTRGVQTQLLAVRGRLVAVRALPAEKPPRPRLVVTPGPVQMRSSESSWLRRLRSLWIPRRQK